MSICFQWPQVFLIKKQRKDKTGYRIPFDKKKALPRNNQNGMSYLEKELSAYLYFLEQVDKLKKT